VTSSIAVFEAVIWVKSMYMIKRNEKRENLEIKEMYT